MVTDKELSDIRQENAELRAVLAAAQAALAVEAGAAERSRAVHAARDARGEGR